MKHGALSLLLLALPMAAQSASGDLAPMAGREAANERAEFYVVPHEKLGLIAASEYSKDGTEFWLSQLPNLKRRGVTAAADVSDDVVSESLAFKTAEISRLNERLARAS